MSLAGSSVPVTPGSGTSVASQTVGSKEHQIVMIADDSGHLTQTVPSYTFYIKNQAGAAAKIHFDIFNALASTVLEMRGLWISPALNNTGVTGAVSPDFDFFRTSAVGTGGTALSVGATTFPSIQLMDTIKTPSLSASITVRAAPTAGATTAHALFSSYVTQEETNAGAQLGQWQNVLPVTAVGQRYAANTNQGFKLVQVTLGVAQNYSFFGMFTVV